MSSLKAYRICKTSFADTAFRGEGAKLYGGRWNEIGTKMVYVAGSLSLATLELLVHIEDRHLIENFYSVAEVTFSEKLVTEIKSKDLPKNWDANECGYGTQAYGTKWITSKKSAILKVPSAVTPGETNYLLNPDHPDFKKITFGKMKAFEIDRRLF